MKYQIIFLVSLACVMLATEAVPTKVCEPGAVVMKDCNECKCNVDGTDMACTRKMCQGSQDGAAPVPETEQKESENKETEQTPQNDDSEHCTPGELFKIGCNDCTCPASGLKFGAQCTIMGCIDDTVKKD